MRSLFERFWFWYNDHPILNNGLAAGLFALQLVHLAWLTLHVVIFRLAGFHMFEISGFWQILIAIVDYTEIPAILITSVVYFNELRRGFNFRSLLFLFFINSQWFHLFWITDEVLLDQFTGVVPVVLPIWLSWLAVVIDYLELPVIVDTIRKFVWTLKGCRGHFNQLLK